MSNAAVLLFNPVFCLFKFYLKAFRRKQSSRYSFGLPLRKNHSTKYLSKIFSRLNKFDQNVRKKVLPEKNLQVWVPYCLGSRGLDTFIICFKNSYFS